MMTDDMCSIVRAFPPSNTAAALRVAEQLEGSGCYVPLVTEPVRTVRRLGDRICESASEFAPPGTQHLVRGACKTVIGSRK
jgi:hypothetical protein